MPRRQSSPQNLDEIEQLRSEMEELRAQLAAQNIMGDAFRLPDSFKFLSEFSGNKKELSAWLEEVDELFSTFKVKNENGVDALCSTHVRAIKNKIKGEARTLLCANGNPQTIEGIKKVLLEHYGDEKDFTTNLSTLFHVRKGDKSHTCFYNEVKEMNTKLKANLQSNPLSGHEIVNILTIAKYLDNIREPLGSIIRNSKPKTLEDAHQAVLLNINAESRISKPKTLAQSVQRQPPRYTNKYSNSYDHDKSGNDSNYKPRPSAQPNTSNKNAPANTPFRKQPFVPRARAEAHNNEVEEVDNEPEAEALDDNADELVYSDGEEVNFHQARGAQRRT